MNRILSYKGKLASDGQDTILLSTNKGEKGYRITKFQVIAAKPVTSANESVLQIWKDHQSSISGEVDFSNNRLLGIGIYSNQTDTTYYPDDQTVIFDNEIFNQDIYITHKQETGSNACNYYLELEVIMLNETEATVATLKDIRNNQ